MGVLQKVALSYVALFGGMITFLTVNGMWDATNQFLTENRSFGAVVTLVHWILAFIYYHSVEVAQKLEFDNKRKKMNSRKALKHRK